MFWMNNKKSYGVRWGGEGGGGGGGYEASKKPGLDTVNLFNILCVFLITEKPHWELLNKESYLILSFLIPT